MVLSNQIADFVIRPLAAETLGWAVHAAMAASELERQIGKFVGESSAASHITAQLLNNSVAWPVSAASGLRFVADGKWTWDEFLGRFGHRGDNEWELASATYGDQDQRSCIQRNAGPSADRAGDFLDRTYLDQHHPAWVLARWSTSEAERWLRNELGQARDIPWIVVSQSLETSLLSHLPTVAGVIAEYGGMLSHVAVVARQLGVPVVRLAHAQRLLPEGTIVHIDGASGHIATQPLGLDQHAPKGSRS
ncbi:MAG: PEP-utilizing enzyme [Pirellulaceae bacterium]